MIRFCLLLLATSAFLACGSEEPTQVPGPSEPKAWVNQKPVLLVASPGEMAVGDRLTVLGENLIDPPHGKPLLIFKGNFFDADGNSNPVEYQAIPQVNMDSKSGLVKSLTWEMWPNIVFDKTGDHLGRFVGKITVTNQGTDGSVQISDPMPVTINIKPSLIPRLVRPVGQNCAPIVGDTLESQGMSFMVEAIGLRTATASAPVTFTWTFLSESWDLALKGDAAIDPGWNKLNPGFSLDPGGIVRVKSGPVQLEQEVTSGRTSRVGPEWDDTFMLKISSTASGVHDVGETRVKELRTGTLPEEGNNAQLNVNVAATDASGKSISLSIRLTIHRIAEILYDGNQTVAEYYEPRQISGCTPGGDIGTELSYQESQSERRDRSVSYNWNTGYSAGIWHVINVSVSYGFGVAVSEAASSDKSHSSSVSKHILPGNYGTMYRQMVRLRRVGQMVGYNECGQALNLGEALLTDWTWSPEVASGRTCPPASRLPKAQKFD